MDCEQVGPEPLIHNELTLNSQTMLQLQSARFLVATRLFLYNCYAFDGTSKSKNEPFLMVLWHANNEKTVHPVTHSYVIYSLCWNVQTELYLIVSLPFYGQLFSNNIWLSVPLGNIVEAISICCMLSYIYIISMFMHLMHETVILVHQQQTPP